MIGWWLDDWIMIGCLDDIMTGWIWWMLTLDKNGAAIRSKWDHVWGLGHAMSSARLSRYAWRLQTLPKSIFSLLSFLSLPKSDLTHTEKRENTLAHGISCLKNIFSPAVFQALTEVAMKRDLLPEEEGMGQHPESLVEVNSQSTTVCFSTFHMFAG